jgi:hypothetical protein
MINLLVLSTIIANTLAGVAAVTTLANAAIRNGSVRSRRKIDS